MESVNKKIILLTVIMAILTTVIVYMFIKNQTEVEEETVKKVSIYVAAKEIPARHEMLEIDVEKIDIEAEYVNPSAVVDIKQIVGKRAKEKILKGEQILNERLSEDKELTLSFNISKGKRAVSINVNEQKGVANLIRAGDYVDVVISCDGAKEDEQKQLPDGTLIESGKKGVSKSKIILQRIKILAVGTKLDYKVETSKDAPKTVTLEVTPDELEKLVAAEDFAQLRLTLRHSDDEELSKTKGASIEDLIKEW